MVIILGLGFTGQRLAARLLRDGHRVAAVVRDAGRFRELVSRGLEAVEWGETERLPQGAAVVYSIPPLDPAEDAEIHARLSALHPSRVVYLSSTGVYGDLLEVDENSIAAPMDEKGRRRVAAEESFAAGSWSTFILRPAAIYGPFRGIHRAIQEGRLPRSAGSGVTSRIHADDLAALAAAGAGASLEGAWPAADELPCSGDEVASWLDAEYGFGTGEQPVREFAVAGRRVSATRVFEKLGVKIQYPSFREGIRACIAEETRRRR